MYSRTRVPYNIHYFSCQLGSKRSFNEHHAHCTPMECFCLVILFLDKISTFIEYVHTENLLRVLASQKLLLCNGHSLIVQILNVAYLPTCFFLVESVSPGVQFYQLGFSMEIFASLGLLTFF